MSKMSNFIRGNVFFGQFVNTGILVLLLNMNKGLEAFGLEFFDGKYNDYSTAWYQTVGNTIVGAMIFNSEFPFIEHLIRLMIRMKDRLKDRGLMNCCRRKRATKKKTIQQYVDLHSGPPFPIHFKYSLLMNICFVTFMYGSGMPILFVVALCSYFVFYCLERLLIAYSFKQPPSFD